jgi:hypothetical protein
MAVPNTYTPAQYNCNGSTVAFPFTFGVGATSEIEVILTAANGVETILTETTHYTVSAVNNDYESGGTVTTVATYASGNKITIRINVPLTQGADFVEGAPTLYESFENGLDKLTRIAQQLSEGRERTLIVPKTESASISREIPDAATRALKLLGFDASGEPVAVTEVEGITLTTFGNALVSSDDAEEARGVLDVYGKSEVYADTETDALLDTVRSQMGLVINLKPTVNAAVNKLDIFTKSGGAAPTASNPIAVAIPDGNGHTLRTRAAAYLSGTSQIILANAANYWSKGALDGEIKTAWLYAIWDGTGIVWALAGYSGFHMVPTTTTETDDDYFLLEDGSTYTRDNAHHCVAVAKIRYQYDTADDPDHTIQATVEDAPRVIWNPKSDYGKTVNLATTITSATDLNQSVCSAVVGQSGRYLASGHLYAMAGSGAVAASVFLKTGSATYGDAVQKAHAYGDSNYAPAQYGLTVSITPIAVWLNVGDTIHLGVSETAMAGNKNVYGDSTFVGATQLTFTRID